MAVRMVVRHERSEGAEGAAKDEISFEFAQTRVAIGRSKGTDVRLPDLSVSELHATLQVVGSHYTLADEGSTNGTRVNGVALIKGRPRTLESGDQIEIGPFSLLCTLGPVLRGVTSPERTVSLARRLLRELSADEAVQEPPCLRVVAGPDQGTVVNLGYPPSRLVIGRGDDAGLRLTDRDVSRAHLEVERDLDGALARDLESKNGLIVNGKRLRERRLRHGDVLSLGTSEVRFEDAADAALKNLEGQPDEAVTRTLPRASASLPAVAGSSQPLATPAAASTSAKPVQALPEAAMATRTDSGDLLIYGLAALVLLASVLGLVWLFGS